jgi:hypothetical protein
MHKINFLLCHMLLEKTELNAACWEFLLLANQWEVNPESSN